jgi:hypothetical protein
VEIADKKRNLQEKLAKSQSMSNIQKQIFIKKLIKKIQQFFIHNINLSKENFKFDHFKDEKKDNSDDISAKEIIRIGDKVTFRDKKNFTTMDDFLKKYYHLKMHGDYSKLTSIEML